MTKEQKLRRNRFAADFNDRGDDFVLFDLDLMLDEVEPHPVPLNPPLDDDDIIDRLLVNTGFEASIKLEEVDGIPNVLVVDDISLADGFTETDKCTVEPVELTLQNRQIETKEISAMDIHLVIDPDEILDKKDTIDRFLVNPVFDDNDEEDKVPELLMIDNKDLADDFPNFDQFVIEPIEVEQNRQVETEEFSDTHSMTGSDKMTVEGKTIGGLFVDTGFEVNNELNEDAGVPNARLIDNVSTGNKPGINFEEQNAITTDRGIIDSRESKLMLDKDKTDVFLLKEEISEAANQQQTISEKNYPKEDSEIINNEPGMITLRSVRSKHEYIKKQIQETENKAKNTSAITYVSLGFGIIALLSSVVMGILLSSVQTKVSKLTELVSILEEDMSSIAEKNSDLDINNSNSSLERLNQKVNGFPKRLEKQTPYSSDTSEIEMSADLTKESTVNKSLDSPQTKSSVSEKEKPLEAVKKISPETKANKTQNGAGWSVNLTAFEDLSYAKSKAAKYLQKGISVKVIAVDMNNTTWYRLRVGGFKHKEEATSYAAKIKKSLNLNSVSVVNN